MPALSREGDTISPHKCGVIPTADAGSPNVNANGQPVHRKGDVNTAHPYSSDGCPTHVMSLSIGSSTVFINGKPAARIGDQYTACTPPIALTQGSPNVSAGG